MIVYFDTSSLIKLLIWEENSRETGAVAASAVGLATSSLSYVEIASTLARKTREGRLPPTERKKVQHQFDEEWLNFSQIPMDEAILHQAALLSDKQALRALDAIHLASAVVLRKTYGPKVHFLSADRHLLHAAQKLSFSIP